MTLTLAHRGDILITSRLRYWGARVEQMALGLLSETDASAFLLERTAERRHQRADDLEKAQELVRELGCLPLALEQAAAYIVLHQTSLAGYLEEFLANQERELVPTCINQRKNV